MALESEFSYGFFHGESLFILSLGDDRKVFQVLNELIVLFYR